MKKSFFTLLLLTFAFTFSASAAPVSQFKIGYFDMDSLLNIMPQMKTAMDSTNRFAKSLNDELEKMKQNYTDLVIDYDANVAGLSPGQKALKEKTIKDVEANIQAFQQGARNEIQQLTAKLMDGIYKLINDAAKKVADRLGYAFILNGSRTQNTVIYSSNSYNVFNEMCVELKIPLPKK